MAETTEERIRREEIEKSPEYQALKDVEGIDITKLTGGGEDPPPGDPPPGDPPPGDPPPTDPPKGDPPPGDPPPGDPPKGDPPPADTFPLNEIFGDRFASVDELRGADIPKQLEELETLRQENQTLKGQVENPTIGFANDNVALFNEFVKETGINDFRVFGQIANADLEKIDHMEALVLAEVMRNPRLSGREDLLRKSLQEKYQVDPQLVEDGTITSDKLEMNKITLETEASGAVKSLKEIKEKVKLPEKRETTTPPGGKKLSPEQEAVLTDGWKDIGGKISAEWKAIPLTPEGAKNPILNYALADADKKTIVDDAVAFVVENQMELNEANVKKAFGMMRDNFILSNMPKIIHSVAEKVRGMTKEQLDAIYDNPSALNSDQPPAGEDGAEDPAAKAFKMEMDALNGKQ
jgi:hypothetical protein